MRRLSSLGSRNLRHRRGRTVLTGAGIALGVAIFFGVVVTNATTNTGVDRLVEDFTGRADVLVDAPGALDATLPPGAVQRLSGLPGVRDVSGTLALRAGMPQARSSDPVRIGLRGVDLTAERRIQNLELASGRFFTGDAPQIVLPRKLARRAGVRVGGTVTLGTPTGPRDVTIAGILRDTGGGRANDGEVAYTSLGVARLFAGRGEVFTGAALVLEDGTDTAAWISSNNATLGPGYELQDAAALAQGFKDFLAILQAFFTFFAAITLFVGSFLIYLTLSMAVVERTKIYGTLRALGATRGQVRRVVVAEAAALGAVSTVAGLALGLLLAKGLLVLVAGLFRLDLPGLTVGASAVAGGVAVGMLTTLAAAVVPALRAGKLSPVIAMKGDHASEQRLGRGWIAGIALVAAGTGLRLAASSSAAVAGLATLVLLLGTVLLVPLLLRPLASVLGRITHHIAPGVGDIAVLHLVKERSRSAYTLALIMVVMAMLFAVGGLNTSMGSALDAALDRQFGSDLVVRGGGGISAEAERTATSVPGVAHISPLRIGGTRTRIDGEQKRVFLRIIDPASYFEVASFSWTGSTTDANARAALRRGGVLVPQGLADRLGSRTGGTIELETLKGPHRFTVAGTFSSFEGQPEVVVGAADGREWFGADRPIALLIGVARDADVHVVARALRRDVGRPNNLSVETAAEQKAEAHKQFNRFFNIFYAILAVAAIVGLLSLANTLAMSVLRRFREIGILRAIGVTRDQVWRLVLVESATLSLVAFLLSLPLGWLLSALVVRGAGEAFGIPVPYRFPWTWVAIVGAFGIVVAVIAAIAPGRRAARLEVVGALQYE